MGNDSGILGKGRRMVGAVAARWKVATAFAAVALSWALMAPSTYAQMVLPTGITDTQLEDLVTATMERFLLYFIIGVGALVAIGLTVGLTMWLVGIFGAKRRGVKG